MILYVLMSAMAIATALTASSLHPVILVPGYQASRLLYTVDRSVPGSPSICPPKSINSTLWQSFLNTIDPIDSACWYQCARLYYDASSRKTHSAPGVNVTTTPFGELDGVEWITPPGPQRAAGGEYYKQLVDALVSAGYERDRNVRGAQYDWRRAPNDNHDWIPNTKKLIEETYAMNNKKPVILIVHSLGSLYSYVFLNTMKPAWKAKYIRSWILLGSGLGGVYESVFIYHVADYYYPQRLKVVERVSLRTFSATAFLLPRAAAYGNQTLVKATDLEVRAEDYEQFLTRLGNPAAFQMWKNTRKLYDANRIKSPGNFSIYCIAGFGKPSLTGSVLSGPLRDGTPVTPVYGDGDGSIGAQSIRMCYRLGKGKKNFGVKEFSNLDHSQVIQDTEPVNYVVGIVTSINEKKEKFRKEFL